MKQPYRRADLHDALATWLPVALSILEQSEEHPVVGAIGETASQQAERLLRAVVNPEGVLAGLPETTRLLKILDGIPQSRLEVLPNAFAPRTLPNPVGLALGRFLYAYPTWNLWWSYDPTRFEAVYAEFEEYLFTPDDIELSALLMLWNVQSDVPVIAISTDVAIRQLTDDEQVQANDAAQSLFSDWPNVTADGVPSVLLTTRHRAGLFLAGTDAQGAEVLAGWRQQVNHEANAVLLGLWLLGAGDMALASPTTVEVSNPLLASGMSQGNAFDELMGCSPPPGQLASTVLPKPGAPPYTITTEIASSLQQLWPLLQSPPSDRKLALALRRFKTSFDRENLEDRLVDYWIALEALFLPESQELSYRASLRIAQFVGETAAQRIALADTVKRSYNCRSRIVHGELVKPGQLEPHLNHTQAFLRMALLKSVLANRAPDTVALEEELLS